ATTGTSGRRREVCAACTSIQCRKAVRSRDCCTEIHYCVQRVQWVSLGNVRREDTSHWTLASLTYRNRGARHCSTGWTDAIATDQLCIVGHRRPTLATLSVASF